MVRLGRLRNVFTDRAGHQGAALRRRRPASPAALVASSLVIAYRTRPIYAPVSPEQAEPRPLPRARSSRCAGSRTIVVARRRRPARRRRRGRAVADLPAVAQRACRSASRTRSSTSTSASSSSPCRGCASSRLPDDGRSCSPLIAAAVTHYLYGGLQLQARRRAHDHGRAGAPVGAARRSSCCCGRGSYWLDRYGLTTRALAGCITGLTYTDAHAVLPAKAILAIAARSSAPALFFATIWTALLAAARRRRRPAARLRHRRRAASTRPLVQRFKVEPERADAGGAVHRAQHRGDPRGVRPGRRARRRTYNAQTDRRPAASCATTPTTVPGIRLLDPAVVSPTLQAAAAVKSATTQFPDALDVDRYTIDGKPQRHGRSPSASSTSTASPPASATGSTTTPSTPTASASSRPTATSATTDGQPVFYRAAHPADRARSATFEPRIYFGEQSPDYSIVGGPKPAARASSTTPTAAPAASRTRTYTGKGGVAIGSLRPQGWPTRSSTASSTSCSRTRSTPTPGSSTTARRASGSSGSRRG